MSSIVLVTGDIRVNKIEQSLLSSPLESSGFPERTRKTNKQASRDLTEWLEAISIMRKR